MLQQNCVKKIGLFGYGLPIFLFLCVLPTAVAQKEPEKPNTAETGDATPGGQGVSGFTHLVTFTPQGNFNPKNPAQLLGLFRQKLVTEGPYTGYFRTKPVDGKLVGILCTDAPEELQKFIEGFPQLKYMKTERLTKEMFEAYEKTVAPSRRWLCNAAGWFYAFGNIWSKRGFCTEKPDGLYGTNQS